MTFGNEKTPSFKATPTQGKLYRDVSASILDSNQAKRRKMMMAAGAETRNKSEKKGGIDESKFLFADRKKAGNKHTFAYDTGTCGVKKDERDKTLEYPVKSK